MNDVSSQCQYIMTWGKCGGSHFTHNITYIVPNYKIIFFAKWENCILLYILESILLLTIQAVDSMQLSSQSPLVRWGFGVVIDYTHFTLNKFRSYRTLKICTTFDTCNYAFNTSSIKPNHLITFNMIYILSCRSKLAS